MALASDHQRVAFFQFGDNRPDGLSAVANLARTLDWLGQRGVRLVGLAGEGDGTLWDEDLAGPVALLLGSEDKGLRRLAREACDALVSVPMRGTIESLNVSVTAGIALYEVVRQRVSN